MLSLLGRVAGVTLSGTAAQRHVAAARTKASATLSLARAALHMQASHYSQEASNDAAELEKRKREEDLYRLLTDKDASNMSNRNLQQALAHQMGLIYPTYLKSGKLPTPKRLPLEEISMDAPELDYSLRPDSAGHYTGYPQFSDTLDQLDALLIKLDAKLNDGNWVVSVDSVYNKETGESFLRPKPHHPAKQVWKPLAQVQVAIQEIFPEQQYAIMKKVLTRIDTHPLYHLLEQGIEDDPLKPFKTVAALSSSDYKPKQPDAQGRIRAVGKRKSSIARVWVQEGSGQFTVNGQVMADYFPDILRRRIAMEPLYVVGGLDQYDITCFVKGGGSSGQAGAISHGLAKALLDLQPEFKDMLIESQLVIRDPRRVEPKKPGQRGARRKFQWVKR
eukprot:m.30192 g.30192  ORF g.30192 m.30192 type:complete len:390 (+) comp9260_c0_seq2:147-1316(+)